MDNKEKKVQIPFKTFIDLIVVTDNLLNGNDIEFEKIQNIYNVLINKLNAMEKRELYTKYKVAPTEEEREQARLKYLEKIGMHKDFIYKRNE